MTEYGPELSEISFSRDECVATVRDYYEFLTKMYLKPVDVITPPEGGWPDITIDNLKLVGKTDVVVDLLRHLPYVRQSSPQAQAFPFCEAPDWTALARYIINHPSQPDDDELKVLTEGDYYENVPGHVVGLTQGGRDSFRFFLDTELGTVDWAECPTDIVCNTSVNQIQDDAYDYAPENEADSWRSYTWSIPDFFEMLKEEFRELRFIPISTRVVFDVYTGYAPECDGMIDMLQGIYREHGWPDTSLYRKEECLKAVQKAMKERYPDSQDRDRE